MIMVSYSIITVVSRSIRFGSLLNLKHTKIIFGVDQRQLKGSN